MSGLTTKTIRSLRALPITTKEYEAYGKVLTLDGDLAKKTEKANYGTADRVRHVVDMINPRPNAKLNVALYRCHAQTLPLLVEKMERHAHSPQVFVPTKTTRYLVVVALGEKTIDISSIRAFIVPPGISISYFPGVWHHPMIALDETSDFVSLVWDDGTAGDCDELGLPPEAHTLVM